MELEYAIDVLKDFIRIDRQIRKNQNESDYEQFCENKCKAIEVVLAELEKKDKVIEQIALAFKQDDIRDVKDIIAEFENRVKEQEEV